MNRTQRIEGTCIWPGFIVTADHHPAPRPPDGETECPGYIYVRKLEDGTYDDGCGYPVEIYFAVDGNVCANYKGHHFYLEIEQKDWPFDWPSDMEEILCN